MYKSQSLLQIIILNLNKIKNIDVNNGGDKIWQRQKLLVSTKYWRRQNIGVRQNMGSTKSWHRQNLGVDKKLAQTKRWCRRRRISFLLGSAESTAADFSHAPLKISYFSLIVLLSLHAVIK
jgi:hypothetical protein